MTGFPIHTLPATLRRAIEAQAAMGGYPIEAVGPAALAVMAFATQALANVESLHTPGKAYPLSNLFMILARSGDAKSSLFELLMKGPLAWQEKQLAVYDRDTIEYAAAKTVNDRDIAKAEKSGDQRTIADLRLAAPVKPSDPRNIVSKVTTNGLFKTLEQGWPTAGIFTSEGGSLLGGHSLRAENSPAEFASALTLLWDGAALDRTTGDVTMRLRGRRLSGLVMVQSEVAADFLNNPVLKTQGLHARFLISTPPAYVPPLADFVSDAEEERKRGLARKVAPFSERVEELLSHPLVTHGNDKRELRPVTIGFDAAAKLAIQTWFNTTARGWRQTETETFFGRALEHAQRLSGALAVFEDWRSIRHDIDPQASLDGRLDYWRDAAARPLPIIREEHVRAATALVEWFADQLRNVDVPVVDARDTSHAVYADRIVAAIKKAGRPLSAREIARGPMQRINSSLRNTVLEAMLADEDLSAVEVTSGATKTIMYQIGETR